MPKHKISSFSAEQSDTIIRDFAEFVEKQANLMEGSGWIREASGLRRWASYLRKESIDPSHRVADNLWALS